jgi:hypothetical protein
LGRICRLFTRTWWTMWFGLLRRPYFGRFRCYMKSCMSFFTIATSINISKGIFLSGLSRICLQLLEKIQLSQLKPTLLPKLLRLLQASASLFQNIRKNWHMVALRICLILVSFSIVIKIGNRRLRMWKWKTWCSLKKR